MIALLNRFNAKLHGLQLYRTGRWFIQHESPCNERWPSRVKAAKSVKTGRLVEKITSRHSGRQSVMNSENLLWNKKKRSFHVLNDLFSFVSFPHLLLPQPSNHAPELLLFFFFPLFPEYSHTLLLYPSVFLLLCLKTEHHQPNGRKGKAQLTFAKGGLITDGDQLTWTSNRQRWMKPQQLWEEDKWA